MPTTNATKTKPAVPTTATKSQWQGTKPKASLPNGKSGFIATGPKLSKVRTTKVASFHPRGKRPVDPEERKRIARMRWKKAVRKIKVMLRFKIPINFKPIEEEKAPVKLAPTYKMGPDPGKKFNPTAAEHIAGDILKERLKEYEYSRFTAPKFAKVLSGMINDKLKELDWPRYKFVTNVIMTENAHQSLDFTSRCIWDTKTDGSATASVKKGSFIAIASIHAVYFD
jgi:hypothetical protein